MANRGQTPKTPQLKQDVVLASAISLETIQGLSAPGCIVSVAELENLNALHRLMRAAAVHSQNSKNLDFRNAFIDLVSANARVKSKKRAVQAYNKVVTLNGTEIKTPYGSFRYKNGGIDVIELRAVGGVGLRLDAKQGVVFDEPKPRIEVTSVSVTGADGVTRTAAVDQTGPDKYSFQLPKGPHQETFEDIPIHRTDQSFCGRSPIEKGQIQKGKTRGHFTESVGGKKHENRPLWLAQIARGLDQDVYIHAPQNWSADNNTADEFVAFVFPNLNTKAFVSRRVGLSTLIVKDDDKPIEEYEHLSYRDIRALEHCWPIDHLKPPANGQPSEKYLADLKDKIGKRKDELDAPKKNNLLWQSRVEAVTAILKVLAIRQTDLSLRNPKTLAQILGEDMPDEALDLSEAKLGNLDSVIRWNFRTAQQAEENGEIFSHGIHGLPKQVSSLKNGVEWAASTLDAEAA